MSVVAPNRLAERTREFARTHPEATPAEILARFCLGPDAAGEDRPEERAVIAAALARHEADADDPTGDAADTANRATPTGPGGVRA